MWKVIAAVVGVLTLTGCASASGNHDGRQDEIRGNHERAKPDEMRQAGFVMLTQPIKRPFRPHA